MTKGLFIAIEGVNGAGKTTLVENLKKWLGTTEQFVYTKEPFQLNFSGPVSPYVEALSYAADRHNHIDTVIKPALEAGKVVICDRYIDSSLVYQGVVGEVGLNRVRELHHYGKLPLPDLTIFVNTDVTVAHSRAREQVSFMKLLIASKAYEDLYEHSKAVYYAGSLNTLEDMAYGAAREIVRLMYNCGIPRVPSVTKDLNMYTEAPVTNDTRSLQQAINAVSSQVALLEQQWTKKFEKIRTSVNEFNDETDERIDDLDKRIDDLDERLDELEERIDELE